MGRPRAELQTLPRAELELNFVQGARLNRPCSTELNFFQGARLVELAVYASSSQSSRDLNLVNHVLSAERKTISRCTMFDIYEKKKVWDFRRFYKQLTDSNLQMVSECDPCRLLRWLIFERFYPSKDCKMVIFFNGNRNRKI
jgi:hypothetical protein